MIGVVEIGFRYKYRHNTSTGPLLCIRLAEQRRDRQKKVILPGLHRSLCIDMDTLQTIESTASQRLIKSNFPLTPTYHKPFSLASVHHCQVATHKVANLLGM